MCEILIGSLELVNIVEVFLGGHLCLICCKWNNNSN